MIKQVSLISVLCPVFNEEDYIENVLSFFVNSLPVEKELLIIDGGSTDSTVSIVNQWTLKYPNIKLLNNPSKYVPQALNIGIANSFGNPIIRLDAHTDYAIDYFEKILDTFAKTGADIVGGPMRAIGKTAFQKSVAYCTSTSFGVGNSNFHNDNFRGFVDSVYLGAWKRELFSEVGMFDTQMKRNQDDEFHYRAKSKGKKIYLNPDIKSYYYPRNNFKSLIKQYYQYGLFKPLVLIKVSSELKLRHLIPSFFIVYLVLLIVFSFMCSKTILFAPLLFYFLIAIYFSLRNYPSIKESLYRLSIYPILHISYGSGFLAGIRKII
jgi:glycosyltransferase involved in cell wall biosynthesis